jgi:hypothetical protein
MLDTIPGRLFVYTVMLAYCVACWAGVLHLLGVV